ncbi:MAG: hypothetical protein QUV05_04955 [Phycisphaerae bacterium]|nr:hypothetical protein [Phycisphaerae bacterium]
MGVHVLLCLLAGLPAVDSEIQPRVDVEEIVTSYTPADNGAGPLWCYGSTTIVRRGDEVFVSAIETGNNVPPLCNTRWQLWHRTEAGWRLEQSEKEYRQREPCPIGVFRDGPVFLSVNPSTQPPGTQYGPCRPLVLEFDSKNPTVAPRVHEPAWAEGTHFTDHSYRGFAADGPKGELLLLNINAQTGAQFVSFRDRDGRWHARGTIACPIRSCYPQVALRDRAAHVMAIGDIVEPNEAWRKYKSEKTGSKWDYVFRRLFYTYTPDIAGKPFIAPVEIETVEQTCGHITNLDLHIDEAGAAHVLYLKRPYQSELIRDKFFPGKSMTTHLEYMIITDGKIESKSTLAETPAKDRPGLMPSYARFHVMPGGRLCVVVAGTMTDEAGKGTFGNYVARIGRTGDKMTWLLVHLKNPFHTFFTNTPRGGSEPSELLDLFGTASDSLQLRYARIRLR